MDKVAGIVGEPALAAILHILRHKYGITPEGDDEYAFVEKARGALKDLLGRAIGEMLIAVMEEELARDGADQEEDGNDDSSGGTGGGSKYTSGNCYYRHLPAIL